MKLTKRVLALLLAATMTVGGAVTVMGDSVAAVVDVPGAPATTSPTVAPLPAAAEDQEAKDGSIVDTSAKGTATYTDVANEKAKTVIVPDTVEVKGVTYTVTAIGANAFSGSKAKTVKLGSNIKTIQKNAFTKSKVKTLILKGTKAITIKKGAFKNSKVTTIKVNKKMKASQYKKLVKALKKAGFKGKVKKAKV